MARVKSSISKVALGVTAAWAALTTAPAQAQLRVELTPFVGSYYALSKLGLNSSTDEERHENQPAFGAALVVRLTPSIGVEGAFAFTPSGTNVTSSGTVQNQGYSGRIIFASARGRLSVPRTNLYGLAGLGIVSRGGQAWTAFTGLTNVAGIVGFGTRAEVSPAVRIDVHAEVQLYSVDPDESGSVYESKLQKDVLVTVGIPISLTRRR